MNTALHTEVFGSIKWNAFESIFYSSLMIAHQTFLFSTLDISTYGLIGTLFAYIFFSELTLCFGLNSSLGTFLSVWSKNKKNFRLFFGWNLLINYAAAIVYFVIGYFVITFISSPSLYVLVIATIVFEKNKQICKMLLHVLFKSRLKSFIELASFSVFLILVWGQYLCGYPLTVYRLIIPFFITSAVSCGIYLFTIFQWYNQLPEEEESAFDRPVVIRIFKNRISSIIHKTSKRFFSSNFLVPMIATRFGMHQAGILKITTQVAYYTTLILRKALGNAGTALFAHTKKSDGSTSTYYVRWICNLLGYAMGTILGIACIVTLILRWYLPEIFTFDLTVLIITCFVNASIMNGIIVFEQWFITHEKTLFLITAQVAVTACWLFILLFSHKIAPLHLLIIAAICNAVLFVSCGLVIFAHLGNLRFLYKNKIDNKFKA